MSLLNENALHNQKINLNIFIIDNKFYIKDQYFKDIINNKNTSYYSLTPIYLFLKKYLFNLPPENIFKLETIDYFRLNHQYIQFNNNIIKVIELHQFEQNITLNTLYKLFKNNLFNINELVHDDIDLLDYYKFLNKNFNFNFINYISDIEKLKIDFDRKLQLILNTFSN